MNGSVLLLRGKLYRSTEKSKVLRPKTGKTLRNGKTMTKTKQEMIICVEPGTWDLVEMSPPTHYQALLTGLSPSFPVHCVWRGWVQYLVWIFLFVWEFL